MATFGSVFERTFLAYGFGGSFLFSSSNDGFAVEDGSFGLDLGRTFVETFLNLEFVRISFAQLLPGSDSVIKPKNLTSFINFFF